MSLIPVKLPLDLTGVKHTNLASNESYVLTAAINRVFVPRYGAFFSESVSIVDAISGRVLVRGVDYHPAILYRLPTEQTGKEIHQIIVITDISCSENILFNGQMLGGEYSYSYDAIVQLLHDLDLDNRTIAFDAIIGKPQSYNPAPHLHDLGDVYGFEYLAAALERVRGAILLGSSPATESIFAYLDSQLHDIRAILKIVADNQSTRQSVVTALGFTPANRSGDTFDGPVKFSAGISNQGSYKERIKRINATSNVTSLNLNQASIFVVTLAASTQMQFSLSDVSGLQADECISFTLILHNNATAGHAVAFNSNVQWANKTLPMRSSGANAKDEYQFRTFDGGSTWTGSLSNANVGQTAG